MKYDYLIVGAGLFGSMFANRATANGKSCLVIDKRPQLGGNLYCECIEGINVHKYGAHIFHTDNKEVWDFVNSIVPFNRFTNSPLANYKGKLYNLPFNMNTFYRLWGVSDPHHAKQIIDFQRMHYLDKIGNREPGNLEEQAILLAGEDIYTMFIKEYTEKQWGRKCTELPPFIIKRIPIRLTWDNNYFNDKYQGIPEGGYNRLIDGLLKGSDTKVNTDFFDIGSAWTEIADRLVYSGPLDRYFNYSLGRLDWRTVTFDTVVKDTPNFQGNAVVNYTSSDEPYTRAIEHKHFEMFGEDVYRTPRTVVSYEYPSEYKDGKEPYYPVNDASNNLLADQYRKLAAKEPNVIFGGRLAQYRYYDMAPIVEKVLNVKSF